MKMSKKQKTETKARLQFEREGGIKTPVVRGKKGESVADLTKRMIELGYNLETVEHHTAKNGVALHAGALDGCRYCNKTPKVKAEPKADQKVDAKSDDVVVDSDPLAKVDLEGEPVDPIIAKEEMQDEDVDLKKPKRGRPKGSKNKKAKKDKKKKS